MGTNITPREQLEAAQARMEQSEREAANSALDLLDSKEMTFVIKKLNALKMETASGRALDNICGGLLQCIDALHQYATHMTAPPLPDPAAAQPVEA